MVLFFYVLYSFFNDNVLVRLDSESDSRLIGIMLSVFTLVEYFCFTAIAYRLIKNLLVKKIILLFSFCFFIFSVIAFYQDKNLSFDSITVALEEILVIVYCIYFFFEQIKTPQSSFIYESHSFWIITGILVYVAGTFFLFITLFKINNAERDDFWIINLIFNSLKNMFFAIAFFIKKETPSDTPIRKQYKIP
jgi:hypothetical protein